MHQSFHFLDILLPFGCDQRHTTLLLEHGNEVERLWGIPTDPVDFLDQKVINVFLFRDLEDTLDFLPVEVRSCLSLIGEWLIGQCNIFLLGYVFKLRDLSLDTACVRLPIIVLIVLFVFSLAVTAHPSVDDPNLSVIFR